MILNFIIVVPVIIGLVEAIKRAKFLNKRLLPLVAVFLGLGISAWIGGYEALLEGVMAGLMSCGLWSGTKTAIGK